MSAEDKRTTEQQKAVERAGSIGSGKPEGALKNNKDSLANASPETRANGDKRP